MQGKTLRVRYVMLLGLPLVLIVLSVLLVCIRLLGDEMGTIQSNHHVEKFQLHIMNSDINVDLLTLLNVVVACSSLKGQVAYYNQKRFVNMKDV